MPTTWHKGIDLFQTQKLTEQQIRRLQGITVYVYIMCFFCLVYCEDLQCFITPTSPYLMCYSCTPLPTVLGASLTSSQYSTAAVSSEDLQLIQTILKWPPENTFPGWQFNTHSCSIKLMQWASVLFCKQLCMLWSSEGDGVQIFLCSNCELFLFALQVNMPCCHMLTRKHCQIMDHRLQWYTTSLALHWRSGSIWSAVEWH